MGRKPSLSFEAAKAIRAEYFENPKITFEYLADKYNVSHATISNIITNQTYYDPDYVKPEKKLHGGPKQAVFIPDHINEMKDQFVPIAQTAHRAKGQNHVINKFS